MIIEVKYYKQYDLDIIGLREMGYPIGDMIKKCLIAYANHTPIKLSLGKIEQSINFSDTKSFRCRLKITDATTVNLLKNIRPRYRNSFCKMLLRESLSMQNLSVFYMNNEWIQYEKERYNDKSNVIDINHATVKQRHLEYQNELIQNVIGVSNEHVPKMPEIVSKPIQAPKPEIIEKNVRSNNAESNPILKEDNNSVDKGDDDELLSIFDGLMA